MLIATARQLTAIVAQPMIAWQKAPCAKGDIVPLAAAIRTCAHVDLFACVRFASSVN